MQTNTVLLTLACSATAHWVATCVMALYARHKVQYLALAWINGIFAFLLSLATMYSPIIAQGNPGILHPLMLLILLVFCYLQSIYPLSIPMPGYLQWGRMWKYAIPAINLMIAYVLLMVAKGHPAYIHTWDDLRNNIFSFDIIIRLAGLGVSIYYIINIFRLPHHIARNADVPRYLIGYSAALGFSVAFYAVTCIFYDPRLTIAYIIIFTLLNLYLVFRILETMAVHLPKPTVKVVEKEPTLEVVRKPNAKTSTKPTACVFSMLSFGCRTTKQSGQTALSAATAFVAV